MLGIMPVPGTMKRAPKELMIVWVLATTLPLPSATVRCVVCDPPSPAATSALQLWALLI